MASENNPFKSSVAVVLSAALMVVSSGPASVDVFAQAYRASAPAAPSLGAPALPGAAPAPLAAPGLGDAAPALPALEAPISAPDGLPSLQAVPERSRKGGRASKTPSPAFMEDDEDAPSAGPDGAITGQGPDDRGDTDRGDASAWDTGDRFFDGGGLHAAPEAPVPAGAPDAISDASLPRLGPKAARVSVLGRSGLHAAPEAEGDAFSQWKSRFDALGYTSVLRPGFLFKADFKNQANQAVISEGMRLGGVAPIKGLVFYAVPQDVPGSGAEIAKAHGLVRSGVKALNASKPAEALHHFETAMTAYSKEQALSSNDAYKANFKMVYLLTKVGAVDLLKQMIAEQEGRQVAGARVLQAKRFLERASYGANVQTVAPTLEEAAALQAISKSNIEEALAKFESDPARMQTLKASISRYAENARKAAVGTNALAVSDKKEKEPENPFALSDRDYPNLKNFTRNLTAEAYDGKLSPVIGREKEVGALVRTLVRWTKSNPVLIGEAGTGKTAIVEGLAQRIAKGEIAELKGRVILQVDLAAFTAGAKFVGDTEKRFKDLMDEATSVNGKAILFIDELHSILGLGSGSAGNPDLANMLKPAIARGEVSVIGATTLDEFRKIEKDKALTRRFKPVMITEPTPEEAAKIMEGLLPKMQEHHKVSFEAGLSKHAVALAHRYLTERKLPDSSIDLLDEAASRARMAGAKTVKAADVDAVLSEWTGVPVAKLGEDEMASLRGLGGRMKAEVVRQDEAIDAVTAAIKRNRTGLQDPNRPLGSFLFAGPTGVGKTEVAKSLARNYFGSEKNMIRFDMSEYMEKHSVARLIGAHPGYVGHDQPGMLTEAVRRNPSSVILFDEIEKADPEVLNVLLQVLDDGVLTDNRGNKVDFNNTIIIMTSNIGGSVVEKPKARIGFFQDEEPKDQGASLKGNYIAAIKSALKPELYNRIDSKVVFSPLERKDLEGILDIQLAKLAQRVKTKGIELKVSPEAKALLVAKGYEPAYGARPLKRAIAENLESAIAEAMVDGKIAQGDKVQVGVEGGRISVAKAK